MAWMSSITHKSQSLVKQAATLPQTMWCAVDIKLQHHLLNTSPHFYSEKPIWSNTCVWPSLRLPLFTCPCVNYFNIILVPPLDQKIGLWNSFVTSSVYRTLKKKNKNYQYIHSCSDFHIYRQTYQINWTVKVHDITKKQI